MYFYKDLFASLCFIAFGAALALKYPMLFVSAVMFGALSRTAARKQWEDPEWFVKIIEYFVKQKNG